MNNESDSCCNCGCFIIIVIICLSIYFIGGGAETDSIFITLHNFSIEITDILDFVIPIIIIGIPSIIVLIIIICVIAVIYDKVKIKKYKKKYQEISIYADDYYLRMKVDLKKEILYFFKTRGTKLIEIPFKNIYDSTVSKTRKTYEFKTDLDDPSLKQIRGTFNDSQYFKVKSILFYIEMRNCGKIGYGDFLLCNDILYEMELKRHQEGWDKIYNELLPKKIEEIRTKAEQEKRERKKREEETKKWLEEARRIEEENERYRRSQNKS